MLAKKISQFSLRIFLWLILPLICVELLMIVLEPYLFKGLYEYDPDLGFRVRAYYPVDQGTITNKFGFNDRDYPLEKTPGVYRILFVGDSFGWAGGQEGNYTALLERQLDNHYGNHRIDIINAGYPMTHSAEQLVILKKYGLQYHPDLVILGFFVGNDFIDGNPNRKRIVVNDLYIDIDKRREHIIFGYPIIFQSRLLLYVKQKYKIFTELRKTAASEPRQLVSQEQRGTFAEETFLDLERALLEFFNINSSRKGRFQKNINYILQSIAEMDALLKSRNIKFIVAIYPDAFQIDKTLLLGSSLVSRHTRLKGRVVESAGIRPYRERSGPDRWHSRHGVDGVVADKAQTHCPRLERLVPKVLKNRKCLDTYELLNKCDLRTLPIAPRGL